jgi:very-short-patch-repair endonuclease
MQAPPPTVKKARRFRKTMTLPEVLLWRRLRARALEGLYFRRQHPIGPYVLDFYCDDFRIAVEVDGSAHYLPGRPEHDQDRDAWLLARRIRTLRLPARLVLQDIDAALRTILFEIRGT